MSTPASNAGSRSSFRVSFASALAAAVLTCATPAAADVTLTPEVGYRLGRTAYELSFGVFDPTYNATIEGRSRLDWSLSGWISGLSAGWHQPSPALPWAVTLTVIWNLGRPDGRMTDEDWVGSSDLGIPLTKFSSTESGLALRAYTLEAAIWLYLGGTERPWVTPTAVRPALGFGYRHDNFNYRGYGASGWQDDGTGQQHFTIPDNLLAITYDTDRYQPFVALYLPLLGAETPVQLGLMVRALLLHETDEDTHILRGKLATGSAWGGGGHGALILQAPVAGREPVWRLYLGTRIEGGYQQTANGNWSQYFYADDPSTAENETGTSVQDVDYYVETTLGAGVVTLQLRM